MPYMYIISFITGIVHVIYAVLKVFYDFILFLF